MYGLSKDIDLSFLNHREVVQVAVGVYQIIFGFDEGMAERFLPTRADPLQEARGKKISARCARNDGLGGGPEEDEE